MTIDKKSPIPAYFQLKGILMDRIRGGVYVPGGLIPSERELGESFGLSRMTVRQALNQLVAEGVLHRDKGRGTFVSRIKLEQRNIMSFSDAVRAKGLVPSARILHFGLSPAESVVRTALDLPDGDRVFVLRRLRLASGVPVGIEEDFLPETLFPGLDSHDLTASLYRLISMEYAHSVTHIDNDVEAGRPDKEEREWLDMPANVPVLRVNGVNYAETGVKLFYERSTYRSDEYRFSMRVTVNRTLE